MNINLYLFLENLLFLLLSTAFFVIVAWGWKSAKPYSLPEPLPGWFKFWFGGVQFLGILLPLVFMVFWGVKWGYTPALSVLTWFFVMIGFQILGESLALRQFHNVVWVMIPYLYVPYRLWQLYEGLTFVSAETDFFSVRNLLILQIIVWLINYCLDLSQLPRLLRWEIKED
ncbi:hypothetical protein VB711_05270 [Cronbergia sp. UHCC 0137]|uniref:hypothetical protein n=1 Tax=Cronbergia sp. UHCC 0137 TaxID=3110239 RepID=UPI002B1F8E57|nr:hypothetical protein [Cronbergia sp. UHCC 0137]MEA5617249.1 hypothetical protein [Cronbergia sp. UHCC 0137]